MACLPYDALNMFDDVFDEPVPGMTTDATWFILFFFSK